MEKTLRQIPSDCLKIVLFGPESSGKTTLAKALAEKYETEWVPEFMRGYLQEKWDLHGEHITKEDLIPIAQGQIRTENEKALSANSYLFCDTNLREMKVYCEYYYDGFCPEAILEACKNEQYDHYFLTQIDIPWEKDDLRDRPDDRLTLFRTFESELITNHLPYTLLEGTLEERIHAASQVLQTLKE
ncbi:ATP-binding protein [Aureisphaera galaxeae]|uniref:ATP-binding protein n=1 Tax=Aureisphaera galaxeae TaxID=1538023 RepID=UPI00234FF710|nr:ATP-binding protein [Aureisphaera galaxeae]MDC8002748.1 ATP-binding protein [Aureisphaera galaxeae]